MNCEEYRQALASDPSFDGGSHVDGCAACQAYRDEMRALEATIVSALKIDVPELSMPDLPDVDDSNVVALGNKRARRGAPVWLALAASVIVAAFLGVRLVCTGANYDSLAEEIIAHLDHEPWALTVSDTPVSDARLSRVVPANVARMNHDAGLITYAQSCIINGNTVPHLVIQGETGPVTILLMPDEKVSTAVDLEGENVNGVLLPVGDGSIAIIGNRGERLDPIRKNVESSVMWGT